MLVNETLFAGGGRTSCHFYERLRRIYELRQDGTARYPIEVRRPKDPSVGTSTSIAQGAVLLLWTKLLCKSASFGEAIMYLSTSTVVQIARVHGSMIPMKSGVATLRYVY